MINLHGHWFSTTLLNGWGQSRSKPGICWWIVFVWVSCIPQLISCLQNIAWERGHYSSTYLIMVTNLFAGLYQTIDKKKTKKIEWSKKFSFCSICCPSFFIGGMGFSFPSCPKTLLLLEPSQYKNLLLCSGSVLLKAQYILVTLFHEALYCYSGYPVSFALLRNLWWLVIKYCFLNYARIVWLECGGTISKKKQKTSKSLVVGDRGKCTMWRKHLGVYYGVVSKGRYSL